MADSGPSRLMELLTSTELLVALLWVGLVALSVTLLALTWTRWGQSRPLHKCLVLSVLAHLLLVGYAMTVQIVGAAAAVEEPILRVSLLDDPTAKAAETPGGPVSGKKPWEEFLHDRVLQPEPLMPDRERPEEPPLLRSQNWSTGLRFSDSPFLDQLALSERAVEVPPPDAKAMAGSPDRSVPGKEAEQIRPPPPRRRDAVHLQAPTIDAPARRNTLSDQRSVLKRTVVEGVPKTLLRQSGPLPRLASPANTPDPASALASWTDQPSQPARAKPSGRSAADADRHRPVVRIPSSAEEPSTADRPESLRKPKTASVGDGVARSRTQAQDDPAASAGIPRPSDRRGHQHRVPEIYRLRGRPDRWRLARRFGATPASEAAVQSALKWLADNQHREGRWDASDHDAGRELHIVGRDRQGAGIRADTATTGLALLTFLASGHTHLDGPYRENVRRGLQYLLQSEGQDGNLGGDAKAYAKMYCHGIAAIALSEAYGMTGDERLQEPLRRAIGYSLAGQSATDGGWRYRPGEPGDTSQAGWQLMALKSAELAGIPIPVQTRNRLITYLRSVSSGKHGGLASYRPGQAVTRAMTAEALVCWQFLGMPAEHPAGAEAGDFLLGELPGEGKRNFYYWYYGTLAMYQLQGSHWQRWNRALQTTLVNSQRQEGTLAGSWDTNTVWGGYGGRVYTTSLATLCLEVYYRLLPTYVRATLPEDRAQ